MEELRYELRFAAVSTVVLDLVLWLISGLFLGFSLSLAIGLALGSAGMYVCLLLLRRSIRNAVYHGKRRDLAGYLLRLFIAAGIITIGLKLPQVSAFGCVIPFLYPKVIFGVLAVWFPKNKTKGGL